MLLFLVMSILNPLDFVGLFWLLMKSWCFLLQLQWRTLVRIVQWSCKVFHCVAGLYFFTVYFSKQVISLYLFSCTQIECLFMLFISWLSFHIFSPVTHQVVFLHSMEVTKITVCTFWEEKNKMNLFSIMLFTFFFKLHRNVYNCITTLA